MDEELVIEWIDTFCLFLKKTEMDCRISPVHISLFAAILKISLECHSRLIIINPIELMISSKICSRTTYYRAIRQLAEFGYIQYSQTNNRWEKSTVSI